MARRPWLDRDDERLRELYPSERSVEDVAHELGRSVLSVRVRAHQLGVSRPPAESLVRLHVRLPREERACLERVAKRQGRSLASVVREAVAYYTDEVLGRED